MKWTIGKSSSSERSEVATVAHNDMIYVIGGFNSDGSISDKVEVYNPKTNKWHNKESLPIPLHHTSAVSLNNRIYVIGGYSQKENDKWSPQDSIYVFNPDKKTTTNKTTTKNKKTKKTTKKKNSRWHKLFSRMPTPRGALTSQVVNGKIYAIGGANESGSLPTNEMYDPQTKKWHIKEPMPTPRDHLASGVIDNKIFVIGGRSGMFITNKNNNEEYDPVTNIWSIRTPMPSFRSGIASAIHNESIYIFGGEAFGLFSKTFDNVERYTPRLDRWSVMRSMPKGGRHGLGSSTIDNKIYVTAGGPKAGLSVSNRLEILIV